MKSMNVVIKGSALVLLACLAAACNPFDALDPRSSSAVPTGSNDFCAPDPNLGYCPPPPPKDFTS
jgi:hypothetical protein